MTATEFKEAFGYHPMQGSQNNSKNSVKDTKHTNTNQKPRKRLESDLQVMIIQYCKAKKILAFAPQAENTWSGIVRQTLIGLLGKARGLSTASRLIAKMVATNKKMGSLTGVSDLVVILEGGVTLFIELKTDIGKQSDNQKSFEEELTKRGHNYFIVRNFKEFESILIKY